MADTRRVSVKEAARLLDTTEHAIRQRLYRGSLESEKDDTGSVVVILPERLVGNTADSQREGESDAQVEDAMSALVETLREQNRILLEQLREANESNRENRRLLAALTQRIPEIEAPQEATSDERESPERASEEPYSIHAPPEGQSPQGPPQRRSWWRVFFGLE